MRVHDPNAPDVDGGAAGSDGGVGYGGAVPLIRDVLTVFHNCRVYFEPTSALSRMARNLTERFEEVVSARVVPHLSPAERSVVDVIKRRFATHEVRALAVFRLTLFG